MSTTTIDLDAIRPDAIGKYSPLLYKWLTHKNQEPWRPVSHVFQVGSYSLDGRLKWADHWRPRDLILGWGDFQADGSPSDIFGRRLGDIIGGQRGVLTTVFCYGQDFGLRDITEKFWAEYQRIGRCAWDESHETFMIGDDKRWRYSEDGMERVCQWCGRHEEGRSRRVVKVKECIDWSEYRDSAPATLLHPMGSLGEEVTP